jgi:2-polyprenyl-3-methyl-5-hydroxy-6-metoxy-1,4-benzoquinol methylase
MPNINDSFFDGHYKEIWKTIIPDELTVKEVDFMIPYFNLQPGSKVLDLMCGYGRHAIGLARKGIAVTAVDNLADYINEINQTATAENLRVKAVQSGVLDFSTEEQFDLVICMGNSLNFFNAADTLSVLKRAAASLKSGGSLLINSWSLAEIVFKNSFTKSWSEINGVKYLTDTKLLFHPTRLEAEIAMIHPDGNTETKTGVDYIFSINEMENMLQAAGFALKEVYSIPGRKKFTVGEPRAYLVAQKQ